MPPGLQLAVVPESTGVHTRAQADLPEAAGRYSPAWLSLLSWVDQVARYAQIASFEGERGTGKETLARRLHARSPLSHSPFQQHDARQWLEAHLSPPSFRGFLYLERVDLLPASGQFELLEVLERLSEQSAQRVILVASSESSLEQMVSQRRFCAELAFRLSDLRCEVPALRHRREDVLPIARSMLLGICEQYRQKPVLLTAGAIGRLVKHDWPGNLDELATVLEGAVFRTEGGLVTADALQFNPVQRQRLTRTEPMEGPDLLLSTIIRRHARYVLELNHGNKRRAAHQLGISRSTLYRLLDEAETMQ